MILRDWFDQSRADASTPVSTGWRSAILVCVAYQSFMVARLLFAGQPADGVAYSITRPVVGGLVVAGLIVGAAAALGACPRRPTATCAALGVLFVAAASQGMHNYVTFPFLFSVYWISSRGALRTVALAALGSLTAMLAASRLAAPHDVVPEALGQLSALLFTLMVAMAARAISGWRRATARADDEHKQLIDVTRERDEARARTRIAGELHDSVGHDLTAIIALSEGLVGLTGDPDIDEAVTGINTLARQGLAETRRAVSSLANPLLDTEHTIHDWDQIEPLTQTIRSLGIQVTVTETGPRPTEPTTADLAFTVTREAVTNAVRHSPEGLAHVTIAIDHHLDTSTLTIRSQGHGAITRPGVTGGSGIARMRQLVHKAGGQISTGPDHDTWLVEAILPHTLEQP